uniref:Uncharacterized protein n=1 Tax=Porphyridium purpureum TaxID=35688 RepID=W0RYY7_PORPP|nr:hypothetical protein Y721_p151 [Porphyridium purpureum]BAO23657.1 hypothetical protein [Porphyridium purpureum]
MQETLNFISKQDTKTVQKKIKIEKKLNESYDIL